MRYTTTVVWSSAGDSTSYSIYHPVGTARHPKNHRLPLVVYLISLLILVPSFFTFSKVFIDSNRLLTSNSGSGSLVPSAGPKIPAVAAVAQEEAPTLPPVVDNSPKVQALIEQWAKDHPKNTWAISVQSLDDKVFSASLGANTNYQSASIYKLFLAYVLLNSKTPEQLTKTTISVNGSNIALDVCVDKMLRISDNACAEAIGRYIGWSGLIMLWLLPA